MKTATPKTRLAALVPQYITDRNAERPINSTLSAKTHEHLAECVRCFAKFLCRPVKVDDLNAETLNKFLAHLLVNGKAEYTVKNRRTGLMVLARYAARRKLIAAPEGVRTVRVNSLSIKGYDEAAITKLVEHAALRRGIVRRTGLPQSLWWETFILVLWETGMRSGDMSHVAPQDFDRAGWLWIVEHKTSKRGWRKLSESVATLLAKFIDWDDKRAHVWPGYKRRNAAKAFVQLADDAGVGGSMQWIRRGASSEVEKKYPGGGWRFLRHSEPKVFETHYRVDKIVEQHPLAPPEIKPKVFRPITTKSK